jgi:hypothetical protein
VVLRCTQRLLDLLGGRAVTLTELPPADDDWYANLLWLDRQKCLLLSHAGTLFSVFLAGVRKADLQPIGPYVVKAVEAELRSESLPPDTLGELDPDAFRLAKTASRSTLGFMNEMAVHLRYQVADAGGLSHCDISTLNHHLRRTLHNRGGYTYPIELVAQRLARREPRVVARSRVAPGNPRADGGSRRPQATTT